MNTTGNPFDPEAFMRMFQGADPMKLMETFQLPGLNMAGLMDAQRKNIDALNSANQAAALGYQEIARRQAEIFQKTMQDAQARIGALSDMDPSRQADLPREAMERAAADMTEIAEAARKAAEEAFAILAARMQESMSDMSGR